MGKIRKKEVVSFILHLTTMTVMMVFLFAGYTFITKKINEIFYVVDDDYSWMFQVDSIEETDKSLVLSCWAFELGTDAKFGDYQVILYDTDNDKGYYGSVEYVKREDVNNYFLCEYDYLNSGIVVSFKVNKLDLENAVYEVLIRPEGTRDSFATNIFYAGGEMVYVHPDEFVPLNVAGTDLENIITEGNLRVYRPDFGMYVYQYNGELYWVADTFYKFTEEKTYIEYQMNTTQIEYLPQDRLDAGHYWSNLRFYFEDNELAEWNTGKYRVTKSALPTEYSITDMWTGYYDNGWIWKQYFRPVYVFGND